MNKKNSNKEIEKMIANVKATMGVEGMEMPKISEELGRKALKGEITFEKAKELIIKEIKAYLKS